MATEKRLIDANALVEFLKEQKDKETGAYSKGRNNGINVAIGAIRNEEICPTVDAVEVVHGRWEHSESMVLSAKCSKCKGWVTKHSVNGPDFNYCPNCGAKMDGDGNG